MTDEKDLEMLQADVVNLKEKMEKFETQIKELKNVVEGTLVDIRQLISELENPFNYIQKFFPVGELEKSEDKKSEENYESNKLEEKRETDTLLKNHSFHSFNEEQRIRDDFQQSKTNEILTKEENNFSNIIICTKILVELFGKSNLYKILTYYLNKNWITQEIFSAITESLSTLDKFKDTIEEEKITLEDHIIALSLIQSLIKNRADLIFPILPKLLNRQINLAEVK